MKRLPAPYSLDLRQTALAAVKRGARKSTVSQMLSISRKPLDTWLQREIQTGDCAAITQYQQGCRHKSTDWQRFREFVQQHGGKTQAQLATLWGDTVTQPNISAALHKIGVSRKNTLTAIKNGMHSSAKRSRTAYSGYRLRKPQFGRLESPP